jgi:hypothetical protein
MMDRFVRAAGQDAVVFRALLETVLCLALPQEVLQRPGIRERVDAPANGAPMQMPGPDREQLLRLLDV